MATPKKPAKAAKPAVKKKSAPKSREAGGSATVAGTPQPMEGLVYDVQGLTPEEWAAVLTSINDFVANAKAVGGIVAVAKIPRPKTGGG